MASASASMRLRSWASVKTSNSSARFSGSGEMKAVSRSNKDLWGLRSVDLTLLECSCIGGVAPLFQSYRIQQKGDFPKFSRITVVATTSTSVNMSYRGHILGLGAT